MRGVTFSGGSPYRPNDKFQLTRLMRGVTHKYANDYRYYIISTHTPHARRDFRAVAHTARMTNFNSHASCEA